MVSYNVIVFNFFFFWIKKEACYLIFGKFDQSFIFFFYSIFAIFM